MRLPKALHELLRDLKGSKVGPGTRERFQVGQIERHGRMLSQFESGDYSIVNPHLPGHCAHGLACLEPKVAELEANGFG